MDLNVKNISVSYDDNKVLSNVSLRADDGKFVTILGESGAGKSTLLKAICGICEIGAGEVFAGGKLLSNSKEAKTSKHFAYMPQEDLLFPWATIMQNVCLAPKIEGKLGRLKPGKDGQVYEEAKKLLATFGLSGCEHAYPSQLSGGMRQRAAFLRTCLAEADIWLLDEPFAALDVITRGELQAWLFELRRTLKNTVILVTHDVEEAIYLSDKIYILGEKPAKVLKEIYIEEKNRSRDWLYEQGTIKREIFHAMRGEGSGD